MLPALADADQLVSDKISYRFRDPERFDIIFFPYEYEEGTYYIKRIIGLPGETVPAGVDNYQKVLAGLNIALAARADRVVEVVAGLPLDRKGGEQQ